MPPRRQSSDSPSSCSARCDASAGVAPQHAPQELHDGQPSGEPSIAPSSGQPSTAPSAHLAPCFYTDMPRLHKAAGASDMCARMNGGCLTTTGMSAEERTANNMDKTELFRGLLQKQYSSQVRVFYGELQFSFLAFVLGHSLQGAWCANGAYIS